MEINSQDLDVIVRLRKNGYLTGANSIMELGTQRLSPLVSHATLEELGQLFGALSPSPFSILPTHQGKNTLKDVPLTQEFWQWLGFSYASMNARENRGGISLDFNKDEVPRRYCGKYQLVTNFGMTEHIANQLNAFKVIHDLTALGGIMVHHLPTQGMINRGLINYNPKFFWMLSRSNGYKWVYMDYISSSSYDTLPQNVVDEIAPYSPTIIERSKNYKAADSTMRVVVQKTFNISFVAPLDVATGTKTSNKDLQERYWTVFKENAFEEMNVHKK